MTLEKRVGAQDHTTPEPDESNRPTETEKLRASDLLAAMRRRVVAMEAPLNDLTGPADERRRSFKERLTELQELTLELRSVTERWRLGQAEDES